MDKLEHVIIAYGDQLGYHHGAKFQVLRAWPNWYSSQYVSVCVVTDKPELFNNYPVRLIQITEQEAHDWSLCGTQHFGIKLRGLEKAMATSDSSVSLLLDTDTYWKKNPRLLANSVKPNHAVMFCDEGKIKGTKNVSINRFNESLEKAEIFLSDMRYELSDLSRMYNSSIIGMHQDDAGLLDRAFELFSALEHTVEQFSLGEIFRLSGVSVTFGARYTGDWSSTGKKNYVTPLLKEFFYRYGEDNFHAHLEHINEMAISRPLGVFIQQKIARLRR